MGKKVNILFGYQDGFELNKEQEAVFVKNFPSCNFKFGVPDSFTDEEVAVAEVLVGMFNPAQMKAVKNLKWLQASTVGTDRYAGYIDTKKTLVTNCRDLFSQCMAEHTFGMMIAYSRALLLQRDNQNKHIWAQHAVPADLFGSTIGIVGLGGIGSDTAKKAKAFGMYVLAIKHHITEKPDYVDELYHLDHLDYLLAKSDFLILSIPLIPETHHLIGAGQFKKMKSNAYLLNVARGAVVDTDALIEALQNKMIAGAGLDALDPEPLPKDNPLWDMHNVFITPHQANASPSTNNLRFDFFQENLRHYLAGEPLLKPATDL